MRDLLEALPRDLSVVDIPFGTGRFVPFYDEFGYRITGLDASGNMLEAAKASLGELYGKCTCVTGDAADLPFADNQFDLVVSTRFLRDIVTFGQAKQMLSEMARVTSKYAIVQLGENPGGHVDIADNQVMGSMMSRAAVDELLAGYGLAAKDRRLVKTSDEVGHIHHIFCTKR